jgi:hypothetical protein
VKNGFLQDGQEVFNILKKYQSTKVNIAIIGTMNKGLVLARNCKPKTKTPKKTVIKKKFFTLNSIR